MRLDARILIVVVLLIVGGGGGLVEACPDGARSPFDLLDGAVHVVAGTVRSVHHGMVTMDVSAVAKGDAVTTLTYAAPACVARPRLRRGQRRIVFLDGDGAVIAGGGVRMDRGGWAAALTRWAAATSLDDRRDLLIGWIEQGASVGESAAAVLVDRPDLLARIDATGRDRLVAALDQASSHSMLALVLARLHAPGLAHALHGRRLDWPLSNYVKVLGGKDLESVTSTDELADDVEHGDTMVAFERCERVRGVRLAPIAWIVSGAWEACLQCLGTEDFARPLADACRTGTPIAFGR